MLATPNPPRPEPPTGTFREMMGARIKRCRERCHLTQNQLSERVNISLREYQRWEAGETDIVPSDLNRIRGVLGCCITELWPGYPFVR